MVIGISGKIKSGKSRVAKTLSKILKEEGKQVKIKSFAQPLYEVVSRLYDTDIKTIKKDKQENLPIYIHTRTTNSGMVMTNYREILQTIGNTARDYGDSDIWVNALFGYENRKINNGDCWIIDDMRYLNEAQRIRDLNGILIRVERDLHQPNEHIAENSLDTWGDWDLIIENNFDNKKKRNKGITQLLLTYKEENNERFCG
jgi:energy-coupling factor transporter ATP-binding protein EcfA2|tara:strand:- start:81 stop:683 length:603 start_codon:yes stop_codon:yes gene_type:complete